MAFKRPSIPALSAKTPSDIRRAITALVDHLTGMGRQQELAEQSIRRIAGDLSNVGVFPAQPAPTGFVVNGAFNTIILQWDQSQTSGFSHTEIWRSTTDNLAGASYVGSTSALIFSDTPPDSRLSRTYYYWIRYVNQGGQPGPFNDTAGTPGSTADDPGYVLEVLTGEITEGQLYQSLNTRIDKIEVNETAIDDNTTSLQTKAEVSDLNAVYEVKTDINGRVTGFGLVADATSTEFGINADRFWVADPSDSANVKIPFVIDGGQVVMDTALIRELTATNFVGQKIVADEVVAGGVTAAAIDAGTITASKYAEIRNSLVYNGSESLDSSYPLEVPFMILSETIAIKAVRLSFQIMPYRAYSKAASSGGGFSDADTSTPNAGISHLHSVNLPGGTNEQTSDNSVYYDAANNRLYCAAINTYVDVYITLGTEEGHSHKIRIYDANAPGTSDQRVKIEGGRITVVSGAGGYIDTTLGDSHTHHIPVEYSAGNVLYLYYYGGDFKVNSDTRTLSTLPTADQHTHAVSISGPNHTHGIDYGIFEENNSPTISVYTDNGGGYSLYGSYTSDQINKVLTSRFSGTGWKGISFNASQRCRISYVLECKLDITA